MVIRLEKNNDMQHFEEIYKLGKEWASEGIPESRFKAQNNAEKVVFLEGYKAYRDELIKKRQELQEMAQNGNEESKGRSRTA